MLKILFWLTIITAIIGPAFFTIPVGSYHLFLFRFFIPFIFFLIILQILINRGKLFISIKNIKFYLLFLILWLSYSIISVIWAIDKLAALRQIYFLFQGLFLIFLIILFIKTNKDFKRFFVLKILLLMGLLGIGFWEHLTGQHLVLSGFFEEARARFKFIPTGIFYNPNDFTTFLTLTIPFLISLIRYVRKRAYKILAGGLLVISFYFVLITGSRANLLAIALMMFILFFFLSNLKRKIKIIFTIFLVLFTVFLLFPNFFQTISTRFTSEVTSFGSSYQWTKGSTINRVNLARNALYYLREFYGLGVGAGNIEGHIDNYAPYWIRPGLLNLHNWWLEILSEYGIFIFFSYLMFYLGLIYNLWKIWHKKLSHIEKMLCEALLLALISFSIASISSSSIMAFKPQWLLFGFALAFLNYYRNKYQVIKNKFL